MLTWANTMKREALTLTLITCVWFKINPLPTEMITSQTNQDRMSSWPAGLTKWDQSSTTWDPAYCIYYYRQQNIREVIVCPELHRLKVWVPSPIDTCGAEIWTLSKMEVSMLEGAPEILRTIQGLPTCHLHPLPPWLGALASNQWSCSETDNFH